MNMERDRTVRNTPHVIPPHGGYRNKLTNVAKASLEELLLDYEDFLRQRGLRRWTSRVSP